MIARIGRAPSPGEVGLRIALEDGELLDTLAYNLFESTSRMSPHDADSRWQTMAASERRVWSARVVDMLRDGANADESEYDDDEESLSNVPARLRLKG